MKRTLPITFLLLSMLLLSTCTMDDPLAIIPAEDIFKLDYDRNKILYANGEDQLKITATLLIPPENAENVEFQTNFGTFAPVAGNLSDNDKKLTYSTTTIAEAYLVAGDQPQDNVIVTVTISGFSEPINLTFNEIDDYIRLVPEMNITAVPADGVSKLNITAEIGDNAPLGETVSFTTEKGTFINTGGTVSNEGKTFTTTALNRDIEVSILSETNPSENFVLSATMNGYVTTIELSFEPFVPSVTDILQLSIIGDNQIVADNVDEALLEVVLGPDARLGQTIMFETEQGRFLDLGGGTISSDGKRLSFVVQANPVQAYLKADNVINDDVAVAATLQNVTDYSNLVFIAAEPTTGYLQRNKFEVLTNGNDAATITANFLRDGPGIVSNDLPVVFEVITLDTATASIIPALTAISNQQGVASITSDNGKPGMVLVRSWMPGANFADTLEINIKFVE